MVSIDRGHIVNILKVAALASVVLLFYAVSHEVYAQSVALPSYMSGGADIGATVESKGGSASKIAASIALVFCGLGLFTGAAFFGIGKTEDGKKFLWGSVAGLLLTGVVYGIVAWSTS